MFQICELHVSVNKRNQRTRIKEDKLIANLCINAEEEKDQRRGGDSPRKRRRQTKEKKETDQVRGGDRPR